MVEYGFDLTDFGSSERFQKVLKENKLPIRARKVCEKLISGDKMCSFQWSNKKVKMVTANNPISGKFHNGMRRPIEKGYASYMGIEGDPKAVKKLVLSIKKNADFIKGESPKTRDFI